MGIEELFDEDKKIYYVKKDLGNGEDICIAKYEGEISKITYSNKDRMEQIIMLEDGNVIDASIFYKNPAVKVVKDEKGEIKNLDVLSTIDEEGVGGAIEKIRYIPQGLTSKKEEILDLKEIAENEIAKRKEMEKYSTVNYCPKGRSDDYLRALGVNATKNSPKPYKGNDPSAAA